VLQVLPLLGRQRRRLGAGRLPGLGGEAVPGAGGVGVGVGDDADHLADERPVGGAGHDRDDQGVAGVVRRAACAVMSGQLRGSYGSSVNAAACEGRTTLK